MKILSIDTSSNICAVAVLENDKLIEEKKLNDTKTHSEKIVPTIIDVLQKVNLELKDFDLFVCDKGPGSFTGIRIGVSTVLSFTDSLGINSIGINSLEALAYNIKEDGFICSLIDAKNSNVYFGLYKLENQIYTLQSDLKCENIYTVLEFLKEINTKITFVGDASVLYKDLISNAIPNSRFSTKNELSAYSLGVAGYNSFIKNNFQDVMPLYLRKSQAERALDEKSKISK